MSQDNADRVAKFLAARRKEEAPNSEEAMQKAIADGIAAALPGLAKSLAPKEDNSMAEALERINAQQAQTAAVLSQLASSSVKEEPKPSIDLNVLLNGVDDANRKALEETPGFAQALAQIAMNAAATHTPSAGNSTMEAMEERLKAAEAKAGVAALQAQSPRLSKYMDDPRFLASLEKENEAYGIPNSALYNAAMKTGNTRTLETLFDQFEKTEEGGGIEPGFASPVTGAQPGARHTKDSFTVEDIELASQHAIDGKISLDDLDSMVSAFEAQSAA